MATLTYYPGCSLKTSSRFYEVSLRKVFSSYGLELAEIADWSCCGATASEEAGETLGHALVARNLALAEDEGRPFFTPCSACYSRSKVTNDLIRKDGRLRDRVNRVIHPLRCLGSVEVKNIIEVMADLVTVERVARLSAFDLSDLRVVPYYGCVLTRMVRTGSFDDTEDPTSMDRLLRAAGTTVVRWPFKVECCGASKTITDRDMTARLSGRIMDMALSLDADAIVTPCPLCQMNLDLLPLLGRSKRCVPVLFFSEVFELALFGKIAGTGSHLIPTEEAGKKVRPGPVRKTPIPGSARR